MYVIYVYVVSFGILTQLNSKVNAQKVFIIFCFHFLKNYNLKHNIQYFYSYMKQKSETTSAENLEQSDKKLKKLVNLEQKQAEFELKKAILALDYPTTEFLLDKYSFNFNNMKSANGHGFLFTILRRFNDDDFISEEVDLEDLKIIVELLLEKGLIINEKTSTAKSNSKQDFGNVLTTPIVTSLHLKDTSLAKLLIDNGADVNYLDFYGNIPLFFAKHYDLATLLMDKTNNIHHVNKCGENALFYQVKHFRVTKLLVEAGLKTDIINCKGDTLVSHCVKYGVPEVLDYLLKTTNLSPNFKNEVTGEDLLFVVQHKKMLDVLYKHGLDVKLLKNNQTVLFTTNTKISFVKSLIKYGVNINHQDDNGDTVLHKPNTEHLIELLFTEGFDYNLKNNQGDTVLDVYKKINDLDLYSGAKQTIQLIENLIEEKERIKSLQAN